MKFENHSKLQACHFWGAAGKAELGCTVLVKGTYEIGPGGALTPAGDNPWPVHLKELQTPYGKFPPDNPMPKPRLDVIVLGKARAPRGHTVQSLGLRVQVGHFTHRLQVFGDRTWQKQDDSYYATAPAPFVELPLLYDNAFGGTVNTEWGEVANQFNPAGKGMCFELEQAAGLPLPNIEDPNQLISDPLDKPKPMGWAPYPQAGGLRLAKLARMGPNGPEPAPNSETEHLVMNWAHPDLMIKPVGHGAPVRVEGITPDGALATTLPPFPGQVVLENGEQRRAMPIGLDTIIVLGEERRLVLRWRAATTFQMRPRELRKVTLRERSG